MATYYGSPGNDTFAYGGTEDDSLYGGGGDDSLAGGDGNDLIFGGSGNDTLDGGNGNDEVYGGTGSDFVTGGSGQDRLFGGSTGDDEIYGGAEGDLLIGVAGNDTLFGGDGNDQLYGGADNDTYYGGDGNDTFDVDSGNNELYGGAGNVDVAEFSGSVLDYTYSIDGSGDLLVTTIATGETTLVSGIEYLRISGGLFLLIEGTNGDDSIPLGFSTPFLVVTGDGNDTGTTRNSSDIYVGGAGTDIFETGAGNDTIFAEAGNDDFDAESGNDLAYAGDGNDVVRAGTGNDTVYGGANDDSLYGEDGDDTLYGDDGNDTFYGGTGNNELYGGNGSLDVAVFDDSVLDYSYAIDGSGDLLVTTIATGETTLVSGIEQISFLEGTFRLTLGTNGDDTLTPSGSNPTMIVSGDGTDAGVTPNDQDVYIGGAGVDNFGTGGGNDTILSGAGDDFFDSQDGDDLAYAGDGNDRVRGGVGNDTLYGGANNDSLEGEEGDDTLYGETGQDFLFGGDDDDLLYGGDGNDFFSAGTGNDTLTLGSGNDLVELAPFDDEIIITDFDISDNDVDGFYNDQLDVSNLQTPGGDPITIADVTPVDIGGGNVRLDFPGNNVSVTLQGVSFSQMSTPAQLYAAGIPCFTKGTLIVTPKGQVPVELLRPGDRVLTRDNGIKELAWVGQRTLSSDELAQNPKLRPIRVEQGVYDNDVPLLFSPQHGILRRDAKTKNEHLVRATHLARLRGGGVRVAHGVREVTYVHLLFDQHEVVLSGGLWSESYYPGPQALKMMNAPELVELRSLFPELFAAGAQGTFGPTARQIPKFRDLSGRETDLFIDTKPFDG